jgi:serine/threonine protein kinase
MCSNTILPYYTIWALAPQVIDTPFLLLILALSFIDGLLAKEPEDRLSMAQALEHEWLAGPSSQQSESQQSHRLGGDSEWAIQSFDDYNPYDDEQWAGPLTTSGTNLESAAALGSDESFSQPMGNLHINTPATRHNELDAKSATAPIEVDEPPSPPLTEEREHTKRKQPEPNTSTAFSSGSLSPIPNEEVGSTPSRTRRGGALVTPTRHSARTAGRPRKSMRI